MYYSASIFLEGVHITRPEIQSLWEEVVIFVEAVDEKEAKEKAELFGKKNEIEYKVEDGKPGDEDGVVKWRFERVERIFEIESKKIETGTELFSRFLKDSEARSLLKPFDDV